MPNRILKESIRTSETIDALTDLGENFFYRLMTACDDYGRFDGRPAILRAALYPLRLDSVSEELVGRLLQALVEVGLVRLYAENGRPYLEVVTWDKHQQVRAKRSKFPAPVEYLQSSDINGEQMVTHAPVIRIQSESESESESESNHDQAAPAGAEKQIPKPPKKSRHQDEPPEGFALFWQAYPRRVGRVPALDEYRKQLKAGHDPPAILLGANNYEAECRLCGRELQFICHPTTFLHQRLWQDYQQAPDAADFAPRVVERSPPKGGRMVDRSVMNEPDGQLAKFMAERAEASRLESEALHGPPMAVEDVDRFYEEQDRGNQARDGPNAGAG